MALTRRSGSREGREVPGSRPPPAGPGVLCLLGVFFLLPILLPASLTAQVALASEAWRWSSFTVESGLPTDQVLEVVDGEDGTPWAATSNGLAWYDGFRWHPVTPGAGLPPGPVEVLSPVPGGDVLVVVDRKLYRGSAEGFGPIPTDTAIHLQVRDAAAVSGDTILILGQDRLLLFENGQVRTVEAPGRLRGDPPVTGLWRTRAGRVWLNTAAGLFRRDEGRWRKILPGDMVNGFNLLDLRENADGVGLAVMLSPEKHRGVWTWDGDGAPERSENVLTRFARSGDVDARGRRLVAYESGHLMAEDRDRWNALPRLTFGGGVPNLVRYRPNGDLWVGSDRGLYLYRVSTTRWSHWSRPFGDPRNRVNEILPTPDGDVWIGTLGGLEVRKADGSSYWIRRIGGRPLGEVTGLARDQHGGVWISSGGSFTGAYRWDGSSWTHHELRIPGDSIPANVHRIYRDREGRLWFLGMYEVGDRMRGGPGAFVLRDREPVWWAPSRGLPSGRVYDLAQGPDGALWFATLEGISRWEDGRWTTWGVEDGLRLRRTFTVEVDERGTVWFGDQASGLGRLVPRTGEIEYLTTADGLVSNEVWQVREGAPGVLWVSTEGGLSRHEDGHWSSFRTDDGLGGLQIWPLVPEDDRLLVGTLNWGVTVLDLRDPIRTAPKVAVTTPVVEESTVRLSWKAFSHWGVLPQSRIATRWNLDGGAWSEWSTTRDVRLSDLEPGVHTFRVQAVGPLGAVRREGVVRSFQVPLPFHRRPAFVIPVAGLTLLTLILFGLIYSRRVRHRQELERQERRYRSFFEDDLTGDLIVDRLGYIMDCNPAFARIFGFSTPAEALGTRVTSLMSSSSLKIILRGLRAHGKLEYHEVELRDRQGRPVHVIANLTALFDERRKLRRVRAYLFDNTERKELEEQLLQSQKMDAIGRLAGGVAHDFNNLLTAINGYTELLLGELPPAHPMRDDLEEIRRAGRRGKELTTQLLAFGRRQMLSPKRLDLTWTVAKMIPLLERAVGVPGSLTTRLAPEGLPVRVDPLRLEQAILNLVLNARDALGSEGTIALRTRPAVVDTHEASLHEGAARGRYAVVEVRDTGSGIPAELLDRIFEPFFTTKEVGEGTGLGLPMVYGIVQQSHGFMTVESREGVGSVFSIYLPLLNEEAPARAPEKGRVDLAVSG